MSYSEGMSSPAYRTDSLFPGLVPPHQVEEQHQVLSLFTAPAGPVIPGTLELEDDVVLEPRK